VTLPGFIRVIGAGQFEALLADRAIHTNYIIHVFVHAVMRVITPVQKAKVLVALIASERQEILDMNEFLCDIHKVQH
jgi:hypothetical protein